MTVSIMENNYSSSSCQVFHQSLLNMKDIFMRYFFVYFDLIAVRTCIVYTQNHVLLLMLMLMFLLLLNKLCYVTTLNIQVHKDEILVKFNEDFHNRFAMQKCDVMFYFNRSAIFFICWNITYLLLIPLYQYAYSPYCSLYISYGTDKENLLNNQELL